MDAFYFLFFFYKLTESYSTLGEKYHNKKSVTTFPCSAGKNINNKPGWPRAGKTRARQTKLGGFGAELCQCGQPGMSGHVIWQWFCCC